ncbi:hypothetical protein CWS01_05180 [Niallia nealsonii]|uniref:Uncharacterized protein n=1 Tax=Niallia nealsonii TaxID=115979 RepID=A0A2N0Z565_9BACI|nr:hypothetical protein CWS01_05180 [Niallia nealsonii]
MICTNISSPFSGSIVSESIRVTINGYELLINKPQDLVVKQEGQSLNLCQTSSCFVGLLGTFFVV